MSRIRIEGIPIGCPAIHGENNCPRCDGGWPGTKSPSAVLIKAAKEGKLHPNKLGCGPLMKQGELLVVHFSRNRKGVIEMESEEGNDYGVGPVGDGIYGPALMELIAEGLGTKNPPRDLSKKFDALNELPVGPVVILAVDER